MGGLMLDQDDRTTQIERLQNMSDEEIHQNALSDPDCPPLADEQLVGFVCMKKIPGSTLMEKFENLRKLKC